MKLETIQQKPLADIVEERIIESIKQSGLQPGDSLPGELTFANELGVSRNVVREAFSRLRMLGVLESKKKRGIILRELDIASGFQRMLAIPVMSAETRLELFDMRLIIELGAIDFIYQNKTQMDYDDLEKIVQREEAHCQDRTVSVACDIAFHARLYRITGNRTFEKFQGLLNDFFNMLAESAFDPNRFDDRETITHRDLLGALRNCSLEEYRQLMHQHLKVHIHR